MFIRFTTANSVYHVCGKGWLLFTSNQSVPVDAQMRMVSDLKVGKPARFRFENGAGWITTDITSVTVSGAVHPAQLVAASTTSH